MDCMLGDIYINKDTLVIIPVFAIHHDADNFLQPEVFQPERFLNCSQRPVNPYSFVPFAAGPRNCLGMRFALFEIKLCLVSVLQRFRFTICAETQFPPEFAIGQLHCTPKSLILNVSKR